MVPFVQEAVYRAVRQSQAEVKKPWTYDFGKIHSYPDLPSPFGLSKEELLDAAVAAAATYPCLVMAREWVNQEVSAQSLLDIEHAQVRAFIGSSEFRGIGQSMDNETNLSTNQTMLDKQLLKAIRSLEGETLNHARHVGEYLLAVCTQRITDQHHKWVGNLHKHATRASAYYLLLAHLRPSN